VYRQRASSLPPFLKPAQQLLGVHRPTGLGVGQSKRYRLQEMFPFGQALVAISKGQSAKALRSLAKGRIKGKKFKTTLVE
jgi:hypothetical protein